MKNVLGSFLRAVPKVHVTLVLRHQQAIRYFHRNMSINGKDVDCGTTIWDPMNIFDCSACYKHAMIVLNRPINLEKNILLPLWERAQVTITVDGGTDQWIKYLGSLADSVFSGENSTYAPTMITGDMDSILPDTRNNLQNVGVKVVKTMDQNHTDYTKALMELEKYCQVENIKLDGIYVIADSSGRFDHIMGNVNTLYKSPKIVGDTQVIQIADDSLTWLLRPGKHRIILSKELIDAKSWCGLVPFGTRVTEASTTGLKWNLDNLAMEFGGLVSTSNTYDENCTEVTIEVNENLVWTMGIEPLVDRFCSA